MYSVRLFNPTERDYAAILAVYRAVWPDGRQYTVDMWRENDDEWPATALNQRFVAECGDVIVGMGTCYEPYWQHQPGTVHIEFHVQPAHLDSSVDESLYDYILGFLRKQTPPPKIVATRAREDRLGRVQFLLGRGFEPTMRFPKASLNLAEFDGAAYQAVRDRIAASGIRTITLSELREREPNWKNFLYELRCAIIQDVPSAEPPTRPTVSEFETMVLDDPALDEGAWFVAVDENRDVSVCGAAESGSLVGMSNLWINDPTKKRLDTGLTGVIRGYRRRGIATALKVCTIEHAQHLGAQTIETVNEENNPMFQINLRLGFRPKPAWIGYRKDFS